MICFKNIIDISYLCLQHMKFFMEGIIDNKMSVKTLKEEQILLEFKKQGIDVTIER